MSNKVLALTLHRKGIIQPMELVLVILLLLELERCAPLDGQNLHATIPYDGPERRVLSLSPV